MKMRHPVALIVSFALTLFSDAAFAEWAQQGPKLVGAGAVGDVNLQEVKSVSLATDGNTAIMVRSTETTVWTRRGGNWLQQTKLVDAGVDSASLSGDGNTAIVGIGRDNDGVGAAWIWTRTGDIWSKQSTKLIGSGASGNAQQGRAVALSSDGNTAIVGGPSDTDNAYVGGFPDRSAGAVWVWTRSAGVWTQQGPKLHATFFSAGAQQGSFVSLSADGNTAITGGRSNYTHSPRVAAWVWTRSQGVWSQQGPELIGTGAVQVDPDSAVSPQGNPVSLSADGNTAIVGRPNDNGNIGAVWMWTRSGSVWTQQGTKLVAPDGAGTTLQGLSVALSADGNTAVVGGYGDNNYQGATWVWRRSEGIWTQQGTKLVGVSDTTFPRQGNAVSISGDGITAITGGYSEMGPAWAWTKNGGTWIQQGDKLVASGGSGIKTFQGCSVAISADGDTAIVGGLFDNSGVGAVWVWTRSGVVWTQQGPKLVGSTPFPGFGYQGYSVAISADGNTALVGGPTDGSNPNQVGAAWVWTRSGGVWTQQGPMLVGSGGLGLSRQGYSVALSADGNTAMIGAPLDNNDAGAAWVWTRSGGVWTQQGNKLVGTGVVTCVGAKCRAGAGQGSSVALSADGNTAIVGGPGDNQSPSTGFSLGAAWVWTRSGGVWRQQGEKLVGSGSTDLTSGATNQGTSVSLSADGNTALIGGPNGAGAAWLWTRSGSRWTEQARLSQLNVLGQGDSVSLSADGNTAMVNGYVTPHATWVWTKSQGAWPQQGIRLDCADTVGDGYSVHSAALSADGNTIIVGRGIDNDIVGAAWIFVSTPQRRRTVNH